MQYNLTSAVHSLLYGRGAYHLTSTRLTVDLD